VTLKTAGIQTITATDSVAGTIAGDTHVNVTAAAATALDFTSQPPATVPAAAGFGFQVVAEDAFGNVDHAFSGPVTVVIATNPSGGAITGTATVSASSGIATFSGISLNEAGQGYTLQASSGALARATSNPFGVTAPIPTVSTAQVVPAFKLNKKGKPHGKPIGWSFKLEYSTPMASTAALASDYMVKAAVIKHRKTSLKPVNFTLGYQNNTVTLTVRGTNPFPKGGQIKIVASSASGVSSEAGVLLNPQDTTFTIAPKAKGITLG
jgi:hypothetical protein